jgi:hypothetical protein
MRRAMCPKPYKVGGSKLLVMSSPHVDMDADLNYISECRASLPLAPTHGSLYGW